MSGFQEHEVSLDTAEVLVSRVTLVTPVTMEAKDPKEFEVGGHLYQKWIVMVEELFHHSPIHILPVFSPFTQPPSFSLQGVLAAKVSPESCCPHGISCDPSEMWAFPVKKEVPVPQEDPVCQERPGIQVSLVWSAV